MPFVVADLVAGNITARLQVHLPSATVIGCRGVRFDETGQNSEISIYLTQLQGKDYAIIWPEDGAAAKLPWSMTGWR